jgi:Uma2 family endonuclease
MAVLEKPSVLNKERDSQVLYRKEEVEGLHSADGLRVSEDVYWETYYHDPDFRYEWNNGILEEKPMADYLSFAMYLWFLNLLEEYLTAHPIARMIGLEIGFRLVLPHAISIRRPDLAVILHSNPVAIANTDCTYRGVCDLCIEFLSDSTAQDVRRDTVVKKAEYCQAGVTEYFILDRKGNETAFYGLTKAGTYAPIRQPGEIIQSEVLPGFQFRLQDLYDHPDLRERLDDSVYNSFILLDYQAAEKRAKAERQRAERLAAMLKELGIDPNK